MKLIFAAIVTMFVSVSGLAQPEVLVRVVDIGGGLCSVTKVSTSEGTAFMVYDAGSEYPFDTQDCLEGVRQVVQDSPIDLMIISHSDADHLADADDILQAFTVNKIVRTGWVRSSGPWKDFDEAVRGEAESGAEDWNLAQTPLKPGHRIQLAGATLTLVAGWHEWRPPEQFDRGEERNVISIVARLEYAGKSVLFTGDAIGRRKSDEDEACKNAEEFMVANSASVPIRSNVMITPHHGGNNGSSGCFISAVFGEPQNRVVPRFVVFPSGHAHAHPSKGTVERYRHYGGLSDDYMLRTDRGDTEPSQFHHDDGDQECHDQPGDDTVEISWSAGSLLKVEYLEADGPCGSGQQ